MSAYGCIYFVTGCKSYLEKCELSAYSLKKHMPYVTTELFTDLEVEAEPGLFDIVNKTDSPERMWVYKYDCLLSSKYEKSMHLDSDTYVESDFGEVFQMLDKFDIVLPLSVHYLRGQKKVPDCFPEPAGGLMVWRNNDKVKRLYENVREAVAKKRGGDEKFLRWFLYHSDVRFSLIPWEYNCVYAHPGYLMGDVKVMHGKRNSIVKDTMLFNTGTHEGYGAYKRIFSGTHLYLFKKLVGTGGRLMELSKTIEYGNGQIRTRGAG